MAEINTGRRDPVSTEPTSWYVQMPWSRPPLNLNDRSHWTKKGHDTSRARADAGWSIKAHNIPACHRVRVELYYQPPDRRKRDTDNLVATLKPICDAIARDLHIVPDDTPEHMVKAMPVIQQPDPDKVGRLWVLITDVSDRDTAELSPADRVRQLCDDADATESGVLRVSDVLAALAGEAVAASAGQTTSLLAGQTENGILWHAVDRDAAWDVALCGRPVLHWIRDADGIDCNSCLAHIETSHATGARGTRTGRAFTSPLPPAEGQSDPSSRPDPAAGKGES